MSAADVTLNIKSTLLSEILLLFEKVRIEVTYVRFLNLIISLIYGYGFETPSAQLTDN